MVVADRVAALVAADMGGQVAALAQPAQSHGHVQGGAAGMLTTVAAGVDDDVRECFSDDEECRGHRSIIAYGGASGVRDDGGHARTSRGLRAGSTARAEVELRTAQPQ